MGTISLNWYLNRTPRCPSARLNQASPQEETFHLSLCKGIYDPKRTGQKACSPLPGREELLPCCWAWDRQHHPPRESSFFRIRKSKAPSGFPFAIRKTPWNEGFSQTPLPLLILAAVPSITTPRMAPVGCRPCLHPAHEKAAQPPPAACMHCSALASAFNPDTKLFSTTSRECSPASVRGKDGCSCEIFSLSLVMAVWK